MPGFIILQKDRFSGWGRSDEWIRYCRSLGTLCIDCDGYTFFVARGTKASRREIFLLLVDPFQLGIVEKNRRRRVIVDISYVLEICSFGAVAVTPGMCCPPCKR